MNGALMQYPASPSMWGNGSDFAPIRDLGPELKDFMVHITQQVNQVCKSQVLQGSLLQQVQEYQIRACHKEVQEIQKLQQLFDAKLDAVIAAGSVAATSIEEPEPPASKEPEPPAPPAPPAEPPPEMPALEEAPFAQTEAKSEEKPPPPPELQDQARLEMQKSLQTLEALIGSSPAPPKQQVVGSAQQAFSLPVDQQIAAAGSTAAAANESSTITEPSSDTPCVGLPVGWGHEFRGWKHHNSVLRNRVDSDADAIDNLALEKNMNKLDRVSRNSFGNADFDPKKLAKTPWLAKARAIVTSFQWEITFGAIITFNTIVMSAELQCVGMRTGDAMDYPDMDSPPDWVDTFFQVINDMLLAIFIGEVIAKMVTLRMEFWHRTWDVLDLIIVLLGFLGRVTDIFTMFDPIMLRLVRLMRLIRFFKMFKVAGTLHAMNLILKSVAASRGTLFWSMLLLSMVQWIAGMFVGQMTQAFLMDDANDPIARSQVFKYYGTFTKTQFTMFEITHANYAVAARVLVDNVTEWWAWFFVMYRCLIAFAFLQVIRSVFIQTTIKVAERDKDLVIHNKRTAMRELHKKLGDIFMLLDSDGSGTIPHREFLQELKEESTKVWMNALDIDVSDPEGLFQLLDLNGTGEITAHDFTAGVAKLRGAAQSRDLMYMQALTERVEAKVDTLLPAHLRGKVLPVHQSQGRPPQEDIAPPEETL